MVSYRNITSVIVAVSVLSSPLLAEGDAVNGEKVFKKCKACHAVGEDAKNKVGPTLNGVVDAAAGQVPEFKYSKSLTKMAQDGLVWDDASLQAFLAKPRAFMKGTKMSFAGLKKEQDRMDVIAYIKGFE